MKSLLPIFPKALHNGWRGLILFIAGITPWVIVPASPIALWFAVIVGGLGLGMIRGYAYETRESEFRKDLE